MDIQTKINRLVKRLNNTIEQKEALEMEAKKLGKEIYDAQIILSLEGMTEIIGGIHDTQNKGKDDITGADDSSEEED